MKHLRNLAIILLMTSIAFMAMNCEQKSSTGPGDTQATVYIGEIILSAAPDELYAVQGYAVTSQITATVTDTAGTALSGILVEFSTPQFGSISATQDTTDENGFVSVTFNSQGEFGTATITASVTSGGAVFQNSINIFVNELTGLAHDITLSLEPNMVYLAEEGSDSLKATVRVMDSLNVGIPGIHVSLSTTLGVISYADTTNATGTVVSYLNTNEEFGLGVVTASVFTALEPPDTSEGIGSGPSISGDKESEWQLDDQYIITAVDTFWVLSISNQISGISVSSSPQTIYVAPNDIGTATIRATVVDEDNVGIPGVPIGFSTSSGVLTAGTGVTDSTGSLAITFYSSQRLQQAARCNSFPTPT